MNVCTKFHSNPFNSRQDISLKTTNVNLAVALEEKSEDHQVKSLHPLGTMNALTKFHNNSSSSC